MKHCPNAACDTRARLGEPAEFNEGVVRCDACGTPLLPGAAPGARAVRSDEGPRAWVTAGLLALAWAAGGLRLPGLPPAFTPAPAPLTALGLFPFLVALLLVELVPAARSRRWLFALPLGSVLGYLMTSSLVPADAGPRLLLVATSLGLVGLAALIGRYGLGNGLVLIQALAFGREIVGRLPALQPEESGPRLALAGGLGVAAVAAGTLWLLLRRREPALPRPPPGGVLATLFVPWYLLLFNTVTGLRLNASPLGYDLVFSLLAVGQAALLGLLFHRRRTPGLVGWSVLGVLLPVAGGFLLQWLGCAWMNPVAATQLMLIAGALLDGAEEWRARRRGGALVAVGTLERLDEVDRVLQELRGHGVVAHVRGVRFRTLSQWLGAWAPLTVLVAPEQAGRGREELARAPAVPHGVRGHWPAGALMALVLVGCGQPAPAPDTGRHDRSLSPAPQVERWPPIGTLHEAWHVALPTMPERVARHAKEAALSLTLQVPLEVRGDGPQDRMAIPLLAVHGGRALVSDGSRSSLQVFDARTGTPMEPHPDGPPGPLLLLVPDNGLPIWDGAGVIHELGTGRTRSLPPAEARFGLSYDFVSTLRGPGLTPDTSWAGHELGRPRLHPPRRRGEASSAGTAYRERLVSLLAETLVGRHHPQSLRGHRDRFRSSDRGGALGAGARNARGRLGVGRALPPGDGRRPPAIRSLLLCCVRSLLFYCLPEVSPTADLDKRRRRSPGARTPCKQPERPSQAARLLNDATSDATH